MAQGRITQKIRHRVKKWIYSSIGWIYEHTVAPGWPDTMRRIIQEPIIKTFLEGRRFGRVLEDGCGEGLYTCLISSYADILVAIDINIGKKLNELSTGNNQVYYAQADAQRLPFKDEVFDGAICTEVIEHLPNHLLGIKEISRVLRNRGRLIISVPVPPPPARDPAHFHEGWNHIELKQFLNDYCLYVLDFQYCCGIFFRSGLKLWHHAGKLGIRFPALLFYLFGWIDRFPLWSSILPYDLIVCCEKRK